MRVCLDQIATALNVTKRAVERLAQRNGWRYDLEPVRGGYRKVFTVTDLPREVGQKVKHRAGLTQNAAEAAAVDAAIARVRQTAAEKAEQRRLQGEANLKKLLDSLSEGVKARLDARFAVVRSWEQWFAAAQPMTRSVSWEAYAQAYNAGELQVAHEVIVVFPKVSARSVQRWVLDFERDGMAGLIDENDGRLRKDVNVFTTQPMLEKVTIALLIERPHLGVQNLLDLIEASAKDPKSGALLFNVPTYHQAYRFLKAWKAKNTELFIASTNPDQWKNRYMSAFGDASADVIRLNQRWEMDATPADWMLTDEDGRHRRYSASVVIDVFSRRMLVVLSPTPKAATHKFALRLALLLWGVPEEVVTDNGQDYQAVDFQETLRQLDIHHHTTGPFSPWEKPHVERGIQTMLHSNLEALSAFVGHNVAERAAIEARKTFAERLFKKDQLVEIALPAPKLQALINDWLVGTYEQNEHGGLGMTPFERAASYQGEIRRIGDERALDILLAPPAGKGMYVVTKKGLTIEGANFIAPELALHVGNEVAVRQAADMGELVVYHEGQFVCVAVCPERTGVSRQEIAAHARQLQRQNMQEQRKAAKATKVKPDELIESHLRAKAEAAGKLAALPKPAVTHQTGALNAAGAAHRALTGRAADAQVPADLQQILDARTRAESTSAEVPPPATNVHALPETAQQRFRKWLELDQLLANGGSIDDPFLTRWYGMYSQGSEFRGMKKRHLEATQAASSNSAGTVAPVRHAFL
ncbi:DDE-type integrase/transposase/recombinase [Cupriavidus taiwanensis]|uniref:DDE-type integrase/transposase/recombinase n=1 Tax=Cupriavidus taiwanensis TaxID=164546 RepID=UPI0004710059|nr:DDE-type integrase/transposase/recombinase [Cupriavidus taiwanensis]SOZ12050.1 Integrase catalytic subunit [Cupriavidus taiwanensis]